MGSAKTTLKYESFAKATETAVIGGKLKTCKHQIKTTGLKATWTSKKAGYEELIVVSGTITLIASGANLWKGSFPLNAVPAGPGRTKDLSGRQILALYLEAPISNPSDVSFGGAVINPGAKKYIRGRRSYTLLNPTLDAIRFGASGPGGSLTFLMVCR